MSCEKRMANKTLPKKITVLDCTLRDGSYAIDYQFSQEDTARICEALEGAGVKFIEIGHGVGMNGSQNHGRAKQSDEEYVKAAAEVIKKSKFGMFCIPGIARLEDLDMAASYGMGFVRVGTNVNEANQAEHFIRRAKKLRMHVSFNMMKSYALPPLEVVKQAALAASYGADVVSVVDSAGGMMPKDVREYVSVIKKKIKNIDVGFHGHNNLQLAMANSLAAVEAGATFVDATLQGIGRSVGNTQTEVLVLLLRKLGVSTGIDPLKIMDAGDRWIRPRMPIQSGIDTLSAVIGDSQFHSSFLKIVEKVAREENLDVRALIAAVSAIDLITVTEESAKKAAIRLKARKSVENRRLR